MGRPLNKKYFANTNLQDFGTANTGGESVASVTAPAGTLADLVNGTYTIPAGSIGAPDITGGEKPELSVTVTGATAYTVTVVSAGTPKVPGRYGPIGVSFVSLVMGLIGPPAPNLSTVFN